MNNTDEKKVDGNISVLLIYTGGTIGMVENPQTGVLEAFDFKYMKNNFPELQSIGCNIEIETFDPPLDSSTITPELWVNLTNMISNNYDRFDGFVILHGTDTMAYSASALSFMLQGLSKPVIFTGSQLPIGKLRTDGKENLTTAIEIATAKRSDGTAMVQEVCIFFDNYLLRGNRSSKISADQFNAFNSFNYPHLAYAGVDIKYNDSALRCNRKNYPFKANPVYDSRVGVLKIFPGIQREFVETVLKSPSLKAIVLETFGSGNAPMDKWFIEAIRDAVSRGIVIMNVTQCVSGYVEMSRYETGRLLMDIGVISGYDSTTESAITKLMYLLGLNISTEEVKNYLSQSLRGEVTTEKQDRNKHLAHRVIH